MSQVYVRLRPHNKPKGDLCRRYVYQGVLFKCGEWKLVPEVIAAELSRHCQPRSEDNPRPLFDVGNREMVEQIEEREKKALVDAAKKIEGAHVVGEDAFRVPGKKKSTPAAAPAVVVEDAPAPARARRKRR